MFKTVTAKLHTMRKPQDFIVLTQTDGKIMIQSDKSIGVYDPATGKGRLSIKGSDFIALSMRSVAYEFPAEFRQECANVLAKQGAEVSLGGGVVIAKTTVTVVQPAKQPE